MLFAMRLLIILSLTIFSTSLAGQSIAFFADAMVNASMPAHRVYAAERFDSLFLERISQSESFQDDLADLSFVSVQYDDARSLRVLSWQIDEGEGNFGYRGYVQLGDSQFQRFSSRTGRETYRSNRKTSIEDWAGGLVYKILTVEDGLYLLTFRMVDQFTKVKTLEPLSIEEGKVMIGRPGTFDLNKRGSSARIALEHSADSNTQITYEPSTQRFIFDNLIAVQGRLQGQGPTFVPDGSYRAFEYNEGSWKYIDKLYSEVNRGPLDPNSRKKLDTRLTKKEKKKN